MQHAPRAAIIIRILEGVCRCDSVFTPKVVGHLRPASVKRGSARVSAPLLRAYKRDACAVSCKTRGSSGTMYVRAANPEP